MVLEGLHPAPWILFFYPCLDAWFDVLCCLLRFITCPASGFGCVACQTRRSTHLRTAGAITCCSSFGDFHCPLHERDLNSWKASLPYSSISCILISLPLTSSLPLHYLTSTRTRPRIGDPPRLFMHRTAESFSKGKVRIPLLVSLSPAQASRTSCVLHARTVVKRGGGGGGRRLPGQ